MSFGIWYLFSVEYVIELGKVYQILFFQVSGTRIVLFLLLSLGAGGSSGSIRAYRMSAVVIRL